MWWCIFPARSAGSIPPWHIWCCHSHWWRNEWPYYWAVTGKHTFRSPCHSAWPAAVYPPSHPGWPSQHPLLYDLTACDVLYVTCLLVATKMGLWRNVMSLLSIHNCINPTSNTICLCAVLPGLGTCTGVLWELVYAREKIHGHVICLLVLTKVEKVTLQVILGARLLPSAGFYSSTLGPGPGNPCCQHLRWRPLNAARLWCQPSGPQSNCPSAGPSCCAGSPSGTRGLPGYTGA